MRKVFYLGYYGSQINPRQCSPAATTMMDYVATTILNLGYEVEIISTAQSEECYPEIREQRNGIDITYLPSYGNDIHMWKRIINRIKRNLKLIFTLLCKIKIGDVIIVYHSIAYMTILKILRVKKKIKLDVYKRQGLD